MEFLCTFDETANFKSTKAQQIRETYSILFFCKLFTLLNIFVYEHIIIDGSLPLIYGSSTTGWLHNVHFDHLLCHFSSIINRLHLQLTPDGFIRGLDARWESQQQSKHNLS